MFFIRDHFTEADLRLEDWKLTIAGRVEHPYELSFSDLLEAPAAKIEAVLECAGNKASGSAVGNGTWEGFSFHALLETARVQADARFVMLEAADGGQLFPDKPVSSYLRVVPLKKCMDAASLVAYKLNGRFLPRGNGFPARALFPGWYAMDSVKWLRRIIVLGADETSPFEESGMNRLYNRTLTTSTGVESFRVGEIQVKSAVAWPPDEQKLPAGKHQVWGFAWTGEGQVRAVSVSINGGESWSVAELVSVRGPYRWIRWSFAWAAVPGDHVLMSRAVDDRGREQPLARDPRRKDGYELNWCLPVRCRVV
jgi:DMSO/TMAO reductase YedYZ molybdopterin-dependent catalytic subunit